MYLSTVRRRRRLTQMELATRAKIDQTSVSRLERSAVVRPEFATVKALARALGVKVESLQFGPPPGDSPSPRRGNGRPLPAGDEVQP